jgi:hypothetical protein
MAGPGATAGDDRTPALSQQGRSVSPYPLLARADEIIE